MLFARAGQAGNPDYPGPGLSFGTLLILAPRNPGAGCVGILFHRHSGFKIFRNIFHNCRKFIPSLSVHGCMGTPGFYGVGYFCGQSISPSIF